MSVRQIIKQFLPAFQLCLILLSGIMALSASSGFAITKTTAIKPDKLRSPKAEPMALLGPVTTSAPNWPIPVTKKAVNTESRFAHTMKNSLYRDIYKWVFQQAAPLNLPALDQPYSYRKLSLFNPEQNILIPLFASAQESFRSNHMRSISTEIPVDASCLNKLYKKFTSLRESSRWLFALTDNDNNLVQFLGESGCELSELPGFIAKAGTHRAHLDLNNPTLSVSGKFHGLASIHKNNPVVIKIAKEGSGPDQRVRLQASLINTLRNLPPHIKNSLVLASSPGSEQGLAVDRVITPICSLATTDDYVDNSGYITVTTAWPPSQLPADDTDDPAQTPGLVSTELSSPPPASGRKLDLVIGDRERGLFHRLATVPAPNSKPELWEDGIFKLTLSARHLLQLSSSPSLRERSIYIREIKKERVGKRGQQTTYYQDHVYYYPVTISTLDHRTLQLFSLSDNSDLSDSEMTEVQRQNILLSHRNKQKKTISDFWGNPGRIHTSLRLENRQIHFYIDSDDLTPTPSNRSRTGTSPPLATTTSSPSRAIPTQEQQGKVNSASFIASTSIQREQDAIMGELSAHQVPTKEELITGTWSPARVKGDYITPWSSSAEDKSCPVCPLKKEADKKRKKQQEEAREKMKMHVTGLTDKKHMSTLDIEHMKERRKLEQDMEKIEQDRRRQHDGDGGDPDGDGYSGPTQPFNPGREGEGHFEGQPLAIRSLTWLRDRVINHPFHSLASLLVVKLGLDLYRYWNQLPGVKELLINKARENFPPNAAPFEYEALEELVNGTPEHLLQFWGPDTLANWVHQACERWCHNHPCNSRHLSEIFTHYVLAPVSGEKQRFLKEIRLRTCDEPITAHNPWYQAVKMRRDGLPAALDLEPVSQTHWLAELDDNGLLLQANNQHQLLLKPIKVMRHSFLETKNTIPMHKRFREISGKTPLIDVTIQYRRVTTYPLESQRYGVYVCATIDGNHWRAIDFSGDDPGIYGIPAVVGYAHKAVDGWCLVSSMDKWLAIIFDNGEVDILHPVEPRFPVRLNFSQMFAAAKEPLSSQNCQLQFWRDRKWVDITLNDAEHNEVEAELPGNAFFRARCNDEITTFTLGPHFNELIIWSWPQSLHILQPPPPAG